MATCWNIWIKGSNKLLGYDANSQVATSEALISANLNAISEANGWLKLDVYGLDPDRPATQEKNESGAIAVACTSQLQTFSVHTVPIVFETNYARIESIHKLGRYDYLYLSIYDNSGVKEYPVAVHPQNTVLLCVLLDKPIEHQYETGTKEFTLKLRGFIPVYREA